MTSYCRHLLRRSGRRFSIGAPPDTRARLLRRARSFLQHWFDTDHVIENADRSLSTFRYYFAQREAVETVIWLHEVKRVRDKFDMIRYDASLAALPQAGLEHVARTLRQALDASGDQREDYWRNRIEPFLQKIWPQNQLNASKSISESFALICVAAGEEFPLGINTVFSWLATLDRAEIVVRRLRETEFCRRFPEHILRLLGALVAETSSPPSQLRECLADIAHAQQQLTNDHRYRQLDNCARRNGL